MTTPVADPGSDVAAILLASSLAPVPFAFVLAATAPFALLMAWFPLWTPG